MHNFLRRWFRSPQVVRQSTKLACESLEDRITPSPATMIHVNTRAILDQYQSASASSMSGARVVVWTNVKSASNSDIRAQRFDEMGNRVGGEIIIASAQTLQLTNPSVCIDKAGNFVVAFARRLTTGDVDVCAQRVSSAGKLVGARIDVAETTHDEFNPRIAVNQAGSFVVTYTDREVPGAATAIYAKLYTSNSLFQTVVVAKPHIGSASEAVVAFGKGSNFNLSIAYVQTGYNWQNQFFYSVIVKTYNSVLVPRRIIYVATSVNQLDHPTIAMDKIGTTVVGWDQWNSNGGSSVFVRRITARYNMTPTIQLLPKVLSTKRDFLRPSVGINDTGGIYFVSYLEREGSSIVALNVNVLSAKDAPIWSFVAYRTLTGLGKIGYDTPSLSIDSKSRFFISFTLKQGLAGRTIDPGLGVFARWDALG